MAVGAGLILPSVAPVGAGTNDAERRVSNGGFAAGGLGQDAAVISGAQPAQAKLGRSKVIDASLQIGQIVANQIELDFVERASAGGRAKVEFAAGIAPLSGDTSGEVEELGDGL